MFGIKAIQMCTVENIAFKQALYYILEFMGASIASVARFALITIFRGGASLYLPVSARLPVCLSVCPKFMKTTLLAPPLLHVFVHFSKSDDTGDDYEKFTLYKNPSA